MMVPLRTRRLTIDDAVVVSLVSVLGGDEI